MTRKPTELVQLKLRFDERLRRRIDRAAKHNECSMNAEIIKRLEQSFEQVDEIEEIEKIFGGADNFERFKMLARAIGLVEAKAGARWTDPDIVQKRGEIAQAIADVLARKVPGLHSVHIAGLGEDGRHIGGGSIGYASHEIAKGGLLEILEQAYANSSRSTNSQRGGSK